jgi:hypothetical protein
LYFGHVKKERNRASQVSYARERGPFHRFVASLMTKIGVSKGANLSGPTSVPVASLKRCLGCSDVLLFCYIVIDL